MATKKTPSPAKPPARTLNDFRPLERNPNAHTEYGLSLLTSSVEQNGFTEAMVAAADGTLLSGNARAEVLADKGMVNPIIVETDGTRPIIHVRTDIPTAETPMAHRVILASNRVAQVDYAPDQAVIVAMLAEAKAQGGLDGLKGTGYTEHDLDQLLTDAAEAGFVPNEAPVIGTVNVSPEDVAAAADRLSKNFDGQSEYISVTCPHCAQDFHILKAELTKA